MYESSMLGTRGGGIGERDRRVGKFWGVSVGL